MSAADCFWWSFGLVCGGSSTSPPRTSTGPAADPPVRGGVRRSPRRVHQSPPTFFLVDSSGVRGGPARTHSGPPVLAPNCYSSPVIYCQNLAVVGNRLEQSNFFTRVSVLVHIITKKFRFFFFCVGRVILGHALFWSIAKLPKILNFLLHDFFDLPYMYIGVFWHGESIPGLCFYHSSLFFV